LANLELSTSYRFKDNNYTVQNRQLFLLQHC